MSEYHIYGRPFAGSLIAEFLLTEVGDAYTISFPDKEERDSEQFRAFSPLGKIPALKTPDGYIICETVAIIAHITDRHPGLIPSSPESRDRYWEILSLLGTTMYPAYHRQHHPYYYGPDAAFNEMRRLAQSDQSLLFNHVEAMLTPYLCGDIPTAADFYFYMMSRWDLNKETMFDGRPKLESFVKKMRKHPAIDKVLASQPRKSGKHPKQKF